MGNDTVHKQPNERMIKLSDLFWSIIFGWRYVLVSVIVFTIGIAGGKYLKDYKQNSVIKEENNESNIVDIEKQLTLDEQKMLLMATDLQKQMDTQEKYRRESVWINIDAYAENTVTMQYYVDTNYSYNLNETIVQDNVNDVVAAYISYINDDGIYGELEKQLQWDVETCYITELVHAGNSTSDRIFTIYVLGENAEKARELATVVDNLIMQYHKNLVEKIGEHDLTMIDTCSGVTIDTDLAETQAKIDASLKKQKQELDAMIDAFSPNQLVVWNEENGLEEEKTNLVEIEPEIETVTFSIKYAVLGVFVGIFLGCVWIVCRYLLGNRVRSVEELQQMYGLRGFGNLSEGKSGKGVLGNIDKWLRTLRDKEQWTDEERRGLVVTNMKVICKKERVQKVFLTSSVHMPEADRNQINQIIEELKKYNIEAKYGECIMTNASSIERVAEIGQVVFVEKAGVSKYESIGNEIGICVDSGVNVLGVIVL